MRLNRDGVGLGVFGTLAMGALYVSYDAAGTMHHRLALVAAVVFAVVGLLAGHFLVNLTDRFDKWREQAIDIDDEDESNDLAA